MQWITLFMVALGIGLWGLLQLVLAGLIFLAIAFVLWAADVLIEWKHRGEEGIK